MEILHNTTVTRIGGVALILAPLLTAIGLAAHPTDLKDATGQTRVLVADAARWNIVHASFIFCMALMIAAAAALAIRLAQRAPVAGLVGLSLVIFGALFYTALFGIELAVSAVANVPADQRAGVVPGVQAVLDSNGALPIIYFGLVLHAGLVVLGVALYRTRTVPRWASAVTVLGAIALIGANFSNPVGAVAAAALTLGLGAIGVQTLRESGTQAAVAPVVRADVTPAHS